MADASKINPIRIDKLGEANGVASLDGTGKIPTEQIPKLPYLSTGGGTVNGDVVCTTMTVSNKRYQTGLTLDNSAYVGGESSGIYQIACLEKQLFIYREDRGARNSIFIDTKGDLVRRKTSGYFIYLTSAEKAVPNGVASLGADGKVPDSQLPTKAINAVQKTGDTMTGDLIISDRTVMGQTKNIYEGNRPTKQVYYTPLSIKDKDGKTMGMFRMTQTTDGGYSVLIQCVRNVGGVDKYATFGISIKEDGTISTLIPTPPASANDTQIPTTAWVRKYGVNKAGDTMTGPLLISKNSVTPSIGITQVQNGGYGDYNVAGADGNRIGTIRISKSQDGNSNSLALGVHKPGTTDAPTTILNCAMKQDGSVSLTGVNPTSTSNDTSVATTAWVRQKIQELSSSISVPVGSLSMGPVASMAGYILCDGRAVSRSQYSNLFTAIGTNFGAGDGSTTFNVPDYRGCFLRMTGGSAGTMYQKQAQGLPDITGELDVEGGSLATGAFVNKGAYSQLHDGWKYNNTKIGFSAATSNSIYGAATEVRPVNYAVNYFIKY